MAKLSHYNKCSEKTDQNLWCHQTLTDS